MASASSSSTGGPAAGAGTPTPQPGAAGIRATRPLSPALQKIPRGKPPPTTPKTVMQAVKQFDFDPNSAEFREMKMALIRKHRTRNFMVAGALVAFISSTYYYTMFATKQEDFDNIEIPAAKPEAKSA